MLDVTVKTLDGKNTPFSVDDSMTVKSFKEHISGTIGIPADQQRIIFKGKVLQDDAKLADSDVAGKVVHVVMRPPPSTTGSSATTGSVSTSGSAAAPAGASAQARRPAAAAGNSSLPRRAAQPAPGASVMVASFSLPGDITDTRHINSIVENVMRGMGPAGGGVHIHSQLDPLNSVDVHIDLREAQHEPLATQGQGRGQDQPTVAEIAAVGGAEPRRCLQQIQSFVWDLEDIIDDLEQLRIDQAPVTSTSPASAADTSSTGERSADASSAGGSAADATSRRVRGPRNARSERRGAQDDGNGRVPVVCLAEVLSQVSALSARLQPHIELYGNRVREVSTDVAQSRVGDTSSPSPASERPSEPQASGSGGSSTALDASYRAYFETTSEAMHLLGHIYHNVSDLMVDWSRPRAERELLMTPVLGVPSLMLGRHPLVVPVSVATQSAVLYSPAVQPQQVQAEPGRGAPSSASESLSGNAQNVSISSQRSSDSSASATRGGSSTGSSGGTTLTSGSSAGQPPSVTPTSASTGGAGPSAVPGVAPVQSMPSALPLPFAPQQLFNELMRQMSGLSQFAGQPYYTSHPSASQAAAGQPGSSVAASVTSSSPGVAAAAPTANHVAAGRPVDSSATAQPQSSEGSLPRVVVLPQIPPAYTFGPPGHPQAPQRQPFVATSATATMPLAMVPPLIVPLQMPAHSQPAMIATGQQQQQPVPLGNQSQSVTTSNQQQQTSLVTDGAQAVRPSGLQQPPERASSRGQTPQDQSRTPSAVAGSGSQTAATVQGQFGSGSLETGGLLDSLGHGDMYLPCNSLFWQPHFVQVARQPAATSSTSSGQQQPPVSSAASRDAPRGGLNPEAIRMQFSGRQTENVSPPQFHTLLSSIINSIVNRSIQPPTVSRSAGDANVTSSSAGPASAGTTSSASTGGGAGQTEGSGQTTQGREPATQSGGAEAHPRPGQGLFDGAAFSSVLPSSIEQLTAFANFVADPALATDGRSAPIRTSATLSGNGNANPLPDEMFVQLMTAVAQEVSPNGSSQRPASTIQDFLQRMASSHGLRAEMPTSAAAGIIHGFFDIISRHLTFADLQRLYDGDARCLDKLRSPLSAFVRGQVLNDGPTTEDNVSLAVDRLLEEWSPHLASALGVVSAAGDIDLISTMKRFIRVHLKQAIMLVLTPVGSRSYQSEESFGRQLDAFVRGCAFSLCQLMLTCLGDNVEALLRFVYSQVEALFGGASTVVVGMTSTLIGAQVESMLPQIRAASPSAEDATRPYIVRRVKLEQPEEGRAKETSVHASCAPGSPTSANPPTSEAAGAAAVAAGRLAPNAGGCAEDDSSNYESADEMEVVQSEAIAASSLSPADELLTSGGSRSPASAHPDVSCGGPAASDSAGTDQSSSAVHATDSGQVSEPPTGASATTAAASPADDWRSQVPQDWVPVIECDQRRQAEARAASSAASGEQQSFSDAYLSGVPAKKRKVVASQDEMSSTE